MQTEYFRLVENGQDDFEGISTLMHRYAEEPTIKTDLVDAYYRLVESGAIKELIGHMIDKIKSDSAFSPSWVSDTECPIIAHPNAVLSIKYVQPESHIAIVSASLGTLVFSLLSNHEVELDIYHGSSVTSRQSFLKRFTLRPNESVVIEPGHSFRIFASSGPALLSRLLLDMGEYASAYDAHTLDFINMLSLNQNNSRWSFMAKVAGQLESEDAVPILRRLTVHSDYNVRWTALQEIFSHSVDEGMEILRNFQGDASPYIREQAMQETARLEKILTDA